MSILTYTHTYTVKQTHVVAIVDLYVHFPPRGMKKNPSLITSSTGPIIFSFSSFPSLRINKMTIMQQNTEILLTSSSKMVSFKL